MVNPKQSLKWVRITVIVCLMSSIASHAVAEPLHADEMTRVEIDARQTGAMLLPLLFGHKLEHSRHTAPSRRIPLRSPIFIPKKGEFRRFRIPS